MNCKIPLLVTLLFLAPASASAEVVAVLPAQVLADDTAYPDHAGALERLPLLLQRLMVQQLRDEGVQAEGVTLRAEHLARYSGGRFDQEVLAAIGSATRARRFIMATVDFDGSVLTLRLRLHELSTGRAVGMVVAAQPIDETAALSSVAVQGLLRELRPTGPGAPMGRQDAPARPAQAAVPPKAGQAATASENVPAAPTAAKAAGVRTVIPAAEGTAARRPNHPARALFWGGAAVAAAGAACGALSVLRYEKTLEDGQVRTRSENDAFLAKGKGLALAADVGLAAGGAAMLTGIILWATGAGESDGPSVAVTPQDGGVFVQAGLRL
jgi:hypothetical protein